MAACIKKRGRGPGPRSCPVPLQSPQVVAPADSKTGFSKWPIWGGFLPRRPPLGPGKEGTGLGWIWEGPYPRSKRGARPEIFYEGGFRVRHYIFDLNQAPEPGPRPNNITISSPVSGGVMVQRLGPSGHRNAPHGGPLKSILSSEIGTSRTKKYSTWRCDAVDSTKIPDRLCRGGTMGLVAKSKCL